MVKQFKLIATVVMAVTLLAVLSVGVVSAQEINGTSPQVYASSCGSAWCTGGNGFGGQQGTNDGPWTGSGYGSGSGSCH